MSTNGRTLPPLSTGSTPLIINQTTHLYHAFDIVEFYPSITAKLLDNVILWAKSLTYIPDEHITIIKHARKSLLFYREKTWIKKNHDSLFDVTMGSYDGAEICELVGLFLLNDIILCHVLLHVLSILL